MCFGGYTFYFLLALLRFDTEKMQSQNFQMAIRVPCYSLSLKSTVFQAMECGRDPKELLSQLLHKDPSEFQGPDIVLWRQLYNLALSEDIPRQRISKVPLSDFNSVLDLIDKAQNVVIVLGAGGSVGPDFRSPGGLYDAISKEGIFDDPSDLFDNEQFERDPSIFWRFAHTIFPAENPKHSATHYFIKELENRGKLLRLYTQNVDTLEIGIPPSKLRCVHGSWRESHCMRCGALHNIEDLREAVNRGTVPQCHFCGGPIKPSIVFFGQDVILNDHELEMDSREADLLLVIGTSLKVAPVSDIPKVMGDVPSILINRATLSNYTFSAELLGECDDIVKTVECELGWEAEEGINPSDTTFFGPNKFIFPSSSELATRVVAAARNDFLVTSVPLDVSDLY
jgi:NAD-dependent SIR2 family protein deacetylase